MTTGAPTPIRIVATLAVAALALFAAHALAGLGGEAFNGFAHDGLYNAVIAASAGLCLARAAMVRDERGPWLLFGLGLLSWFGGELYYTLALAGQDAPPYPSLSDALYLGFYPAAYAGLLLLLRRRVRRLPASQVLDGVVAALAVAALGCAVLLGPVVESTEGGWAAVATDLSYPLANVTLLAVVVGMFASVGWRPGRTWILIGTGLVGLAVADGVFLLQLAQGTYTENSLVDVLWPASTLILGVAAWSRRAPLPTVRLEGWRTLLFPSAFALSAVGLLLASAIEPMNAMVGILAAAALVAAVARMALTFGENLKMLAATRREALTDALTGLGNRRKLLEDLADELEVAAPSDRRALVVLDLDGFKRYNDTFGHPAGDTLLRRLGGTLAGSVAKGCSAYRLGGDEFCVLVRDERLIDDSVAAAVAALDVRGEGFTITASYGLVTMPDEADLPERALGLADQRLYAQKAGKQRSVAAQETRNALIQALHEREPGAARHVDEVAELAWEVGRQLQLSGEDLDVLVRAAELHDIGKVAVPDSLLEKGEPLDDSEWGFFRQHSVVGERILSAAPALRPVAAVVRASHERFDGKGYPDGLAGDGIPVAARIVAVCDAYEAMTRARAYGRELSGAQALEELRRCAGTQFDPEVVEAFAAVIGDDFQKTHPLEHAGGAA